MFDLPDLNEIPSDNPELVRKAFLSVQSRAELASLLGVSRFHLVWHLYINPVSFRYRTFFLHKKNGGRRTITAPINSLKTIQRKLHNILLTTYNPRPSVQGFIPGKSILTNAQKHSGQFHVLNLDIEDFFPSINFGRVRGLFLSFPFQFNNEVATTLAQLCCYDNALPQGAPTSPIIANMICARMDGQLQQLAQRTRSIYTRYADDITFSTSRQRFPSKLASFDHAKSETKLSEELISIIHSNGFRVKQSKTRLQIAYQRQEVTGLVTNKFPNVDRRFIRQVRAMLHAWEKFGLESAQKDFTEHYDYRTRKSEASFKEVVKGKIEFIGMVRGHEHPIYLKFLEQYYYLSEENLQKAKGPRKRRTKIVPHIITEGKTDLQHLQASLRELQKQGLYKGLSLSFPNENPTSGSSELVTFCRYNAKTYHSQPVICIFDRDEFSILRQVTDEPRLYKDWGNNVFSFAIPVPPHRQNGVELCIEMYYSDEEIMRNDEKGRRLFFNNEFHPRSKRHRVLKNLNSNSSKIKESEPMRLTLIDSDVYDENNQNVALSKSRFAELIISRASNFNDFNFVPFTHIFDIICRIIDDIPDE